MLSIFTYIPQPNRYILLVFIVMRKWRLIWRVIYDVIRGKAEKKIPLSFSRRY